MHKKKLYMARDLHYISDMPSVDVGKAILHPFAFVTIIALSVKIIVSSERKDSKSVQLLSLIYIF